MRDVILLVRLELPFFYIFIYLHILSFDCTAATTNDRTTNDRLSHPPILRQAEPNSQSVTDFYSPLDTEHHSDEEDEQVNECAY